MSKPLCPGGRWLVLRRARRAAARAVDVEVLPAARLRRAALRRGGHEPGSPDGLHGPRVLRPRRLLRPGRVLDARCSSSAASLSLWLCLGLAVVVVGLYALVVSYFATTRRGIYFALLTLIFAEVVYTVLPLHAGLRRLRRHPGAARARDPARRRHRHAAPRTTTWSSCPTCARLPRLPRAGRARTSAGCSSRSARTRTARASSATTCSATRWACA